MTATTPPVRLFDMDGSDGGPCDGCGRLCGAAGPNEGEPGPPRPAVWFGDAVAVCFGCLGLALAEVVGALRPSGDAAELLALRELERLVRGPGPDDDQPPPRALGDVLKALDTLRKRAAQNG